MPQFFLIYPRDSGKQHSEKTTSIHVRSTTSDGRRPNHTISKSFMPLSGLLDDGVGA